MKFPFDNVQRLLEAGMITPKAFMELWRKGRIADFPEMDNNFWIKDEIKDTVSLERWLQYKR